MAKTYTFVDIPQPTNCTATAVSGGSLSPNTTYYYRIIKTAGAGADWTGKSLPSESFSATTTDTNRTIRISFNTTTTGGHYKIFRDSTEDGFLNKYNGPLSLYPTDAGSQVAGVVTFNDNGTAGIAGNQFLENRDLAHGRLTISGSSSTDQFSIVDLYNADVANGWGVIQKLEEGTYKINTYLVSSSSEYWTDYEKTIIFADGVANPGNWTLGRITAGSERTFGGCNLIWKSTWLNGVFFASLTAYRTTFSYIYPKLSTGEDITTSLGLCSISFSGLVQDCTCDRARSFQPSNTSTVKNCIISRFDIALFASQATFNDVKCLTGSRVWQIGGSGVNVTARGVYTEGTAVVLLLGAGGSSLTLIDSISGGSFLINSSSTGFMFYDKISYNLTVLDKNGTGITGADIKIYDKNGNIVVNTTSGSSGVTTEQLLTWRDKGVIGTTQQAFVTYSPFKLVVSKDGYDDYQETFSIKSSVGVIKNVTLKDETFGNTTIIDSTLIDTTLY